MTSLLTGKRLLLTHSPAQAADYYAELQRGGALPLAFPTLELAPLTDTKALDNALRQLGRFHWVIFEHPAGVNVFWERLSLVSATLPAPMPRLIAIGAVTGRTMQRLRLSAEVWPEETHHPPLATQPGETLDGQHILFPCAEPAIDGWMTELEKRGATLKAVQAYRTLPLHPNAAGVAELQRGIDVLIFLSPNAVRNFGTLAQQAGVTRLTATVACLGEVTAQAARAAGWPVHVVAARPTADGLVEALEAHYQRSAG